MVFQFLINHTQKHLGFIIDNKLSFNDYVDYIYNKSIQKWNFLLKCCRYASPDLLLTLFKTYLIPIIEYCNTAFIPNITQNKRIESIQRKVTKYICRKMHKNIEYNLRLKLLNLKTLESRRKISVLKMVFKSIYDFSDIPYHWKSRFELSNNNRNGIMICKPKTRINCCDKNFFTFSIDLFNSMPMYIRNESSYKCFLTKCNDFLL